MVRTIVQMRITGAMEVIAEDYGCTIIQECDDTINVEKNYIVATIRFMNTSAYYDGLKSYGVAFDGMNAAYNEGTVHWSPEEALSAANVMIVAAGVMRLCEYHNPHGENYDY